MWNLQKNVSDVFSIAPMKIWKDRITTTIDEVRNGWEDQISEAMYVI